MDNFYYAQEDEIFAGAEKYGYRWSVHRPHTIIGYAVGNAMNMGLTLAVYATLCREKGWPFIFPGSPEQWHGVSDVTDANLLAEQLAGRHKARMRQTKILMRLMAMYSAGTGCGRARPPILASSLAEIRRP